ncbi:class I SAM-dependent methyltransferase [Nonomuraea sediminis]|uniref:class I SAM-dependent methyltransferase n=1 Tax=Nonomuraea sediminis TaxID=2835864 RepID=UPI001BDC428E|nr:methyltransferase domain-containing protein [Nonomuraea sediminis]
MIGELYADALAGAAVEIEYVNGDVVPLEAARWSTPIPGDEAILRHCSGPTLDIGSGPGRLTVALTRRGVPALGIDITPHAVHLTRLAGGLALIRDVFAEIPGTGRWSTVLLADGNIGIGGHPQALLRRVRQLARPGARVIVELAPPATPSRVDQVRLRNAGSASSWFPWATVSATDIRRLAADAGFTLTRCRPHASRWLAHLH